MSKPKTAARTCGKCGESGHSIPTCQQMKAVSAARLKEVMARYGKTEISKTKPAASSEFGLPKQRKYPMEDRDHQIRPRDARPRWSTRAS